ncbi:cytochrome c-type biogenesis protein CcmH [Cocleimonas sp. KMM 6892]|uniref:cytochrome c-type biogenesis protein n=1 Tax=unclassified Cocleimonas TaxID=2639732 RepID=UPI002DBB57A1|nr:MULTISPECIES: cytochrome c-type biogenesis protein [unclassified Cocleimonas]MEB8432478.1 cytochrome c-type biogenesis protein CcmH [Cocleimonas sp. KMM 6892]MEC4715337.1 cytochrome c-type biogenesis protein CcmH [Cocleimonas sp. KMM 6895]MEC4745044.1 cytochrome c-type biogenesis protein CcmH [Cocleimonas sp. KMM 6896]
MRNFFKSLAFSFLFIGLSAFAVQIEFHQFENKAQEQLYLNLIAELRCVKCQNQNLAESNAELAKDMRDKTYEMIKQGKTREDVVNYMTARYGDFVLYKPPFKSKTLLLWIGPPVFLILSLFLLLKLIRKQGHEKSEPLTEAQRESVRAALDSKRLKTKSN